MAKQSPSKRDVFNSAAEIEDLSERRQISRSSLPGRSETSRRIEDFLSHDRDAGSFLQVLADNPSKTVIGAAFDEKAGRVIGPYKLLEQIGEGGMGVVFMADQQTPSVAAWR